MGPKKVNIISTSNNAEKLRIKEEERKKKEELKQQELAKKEELKRIKEEAKQLKNETKQAIEEAKLEKIKQKQKLIDDKKRELEEIQQKENEEYATISSRILDDIERQSLNANFKPQQLIIKTPTSNEIITNIIHIADIHIKVSLLHSEYNAVFDQFYLDLQMLKSQNINSIVCLCGDLLDSKDELKPDTIIHTWNFLKSISLIFPLVIISGNHDRIEQNDDKVDSIEAIIQDRPIDNIFYLKYSGVYIFYNIIFGVNSIVDKYDLHIEKLNEIVS
jgi:hypothetical protein